MPEGFCRAGTIPPRWARRRECARRYAPPMERANDPGVGIRVFPVERAQPMIPHKASLKTAARWRAAAGLATATLLAVGMGGGLLLTAGAPSIRLLRVAADPQAIVIEASEPAAYTVS